MSIYMHIPNVPGNVTAKSYRNWIQIETMHHQLSRYIKPSSIGDGHNRDYSTPKAGGFEITKHSDISSSPLCQYFFSGKTIPKMDIVMTSNQDQHESFHYTLYNVMIARVSRFHDAGAPHPREVMLLNYTKLEEKFTPYLANQRSGTPAATGYDLTTAEVM